MSMSTSTPRINRNLTPELNQLQQTPMNHTNTNTAKNNHSNNMNGNSNSNINNMTSSDTQVASFMNSASIVISNWSNNTDNSPLPAGLFGFCISNKNYLFDFRINTELAPRVYSTIAITESTDCTLTATSTDFLTLIIGRNNTAIFQLLITKKLSFTGNPKLMQELKPVFNAALQHQKQQQSITTPSTVNRSNNNNNNTGNTINFIDSNSSRWIDDSTVTNCMKCESKFSLLLRRKHHCRLCGIVGCNNCTNNILFHQRCCIDCYREIKRKIEINKLKYKSNNNQQRINGNNNTVPATPSSAPTPLQKLNNHSLNNTNGHSMNGHSNNNNNNSTNNSHSNGIHSHSESNTNNGPQSLLQGPLTATVAEWSSESVSISNSAIDNNNNSLFSPSPSPSPSSSIDLSSKVHNWNLLHLNQKIETLESLLTANKQSKSIISSITIVILLTIVIALILLPNNTINSFRTTINNTFPTLYITIQSYYIIALQYYQYFQSNSIQSILNNTIQLLLFITNITIQYSIKLLILIYNYPLYSSLLLILFTIILIYYYQWRLFSRGIRIYYIAFRVILAYEILKFKQKYYSSFKSSPEYSELQWNNTHQLLAELIYSHIIELQGFWLKVGQYISSRADVMPEQYINVLSLLQDQAPESDWNYIQSTIESELGISDLNELFLSFNRRPLATASIAQVHEGILITNHQHVVIKIQHPKVGLLMPLDFNYLGRVMSFVSWLNPDYDFRPVINEWAKEMLKELDFNRESEMMNRVRINLNSLKLDVIIPRTIPNLVTTKVLVMEYISGFKVTDKAKLDEYGVDRYALVKRIAQAVAAQIYYFGLFNGDPHPGNIMVQIVNNRAVPVLLDFGLTKELTPAMTNAFALMVASVADADFGGLLSSFDSMGLKMKRDNPMLDMANLQFALRDTAPPATAKREAAEQIELQKKRMAALPQRLRQPIDSWPQELVFYMRTSMLLRGLCSNLEVQLPYLEVLAPYAKLSLINSIPRELHATSIIYPTPILSNLDEKLRSLLIELYNTGEFIGCQVCVYSSGLLLADIAAGVMGSIDPRPVTNSTLFNGFSLTKPIAATIIHMLADNRIQYSPNKPLQQLDYNRSVAVYWPDFASNGKENCTINQLLSHSAGLESSVDSNTPLTDLCDWHKMISTVANAIPTANKSGSKPKTVYHYLSYGFLLGGLLQSITGRNISDVIRESIAEPLGIINELMIGVPNELHSNIATLANGFGRNGGPPKENEIKEFRELLKEYKIKQRNKLRLESGELPLTEAELVAEELNAESNANAVGTQLSVVDPLLFNLPVMRRAIIPAANGHFSARALAKLYAVLVNDGELNGTRLLSPGKSALYSKPIAQQHITMPLSGIESTANWGLGVRIYNNGRAFGHSGLGGSFSIAHPDSGTVIVVLVNKLTLNRTVASEVSKLVFNHLGLPEIDITGPDSGGIL